MERDLKATLLAKRKEYLEDIEEYKRATISTQAKLDVIEEVMDDLEIDYDEEDLDEEYEEDLDEEYEVDEDGEEEEEEQIDEQAEWESYRANGGLSSFEDWKASR